MVGFAYLPPSNAWVAFSSVHVGGSRCKFISAFTCLEKKLQIWETKQILWAQGAKRSLPVQCKCTVARVPARVAAAGAVVRVVVKRSRP